MGWGSGGASLTSISRATHAWDRLSAGTPAHAVTAVTSVTAVVAVPALIAVTRRARVARPAVMAP